MNLAYLADIELPDHTANSVHIMKMCQAFSDVGNQVYLVGPNKLDVEENNIYHYYGVENSFKIVNVPSLDIRILGYLVNSLLIAFKTFFSKPNLAYTRNDIIAFFTTFLGLATVYESHVPIEQSYLGKYRNIIFKTFTKNRLLKLIVISEAIKNYYINNYDIHPNDILVARDGSDPIPQNGDKFDLKPDKELNIGYVGSLNPGKGMEILSELVPKCHNFAFHIIGGEEEDISFWRNKLKKFDNIKFHGHKSQKEVVKYLRSFDVLIAPYKSEVYGSSGMENIGPWMSPLKIFEYMASRKAIISSDLPPIREILTHKETALLCDPDNLEEWVEAIGNLRDSKLREKLGNNAHKEFINKYTWEKRADKIMNAVQKKIK